jgi:DNA replication and repair protein RecF
VWVSDLQLENFRNYPQLSLPLQSGVSLFHGENGEGKTNLVEAIFFLANLTSHRSAGYQPLVANNQETARLSLKINHENRSISLAAEINRTSPNRFFLNGNHQRRATDVLGHLKAVIFAPEDLDIVRRDPGDRRSFLDSSSLALKPRLAGVYSDYERVIKQRNALLKSAKNTKNPDLSTLEIWDDQLVAFGSEIILARLELISRIQPLVSIFYESLSLDSEQVDLELRSTINSQEEDENFSKLETEDLAAIRSTFLEALQSRRKSELERGVTLVGPHRDELVINKAGLLAKSHASQGEAWSLALGLKLALADLIRSDSNNGDPVLILDDVYSVLDQGRRQRLTSFVSSNEQVLITAADKSLTPELNLVNSFEVISGGIRG